MEMELAKGWGCENCDFVVQDPADNDEITPLYECECGTVFNRANSANENHQCPDCNKFAKKLADHACPECGDCELVEMELLVCGDCNEVVKADDVRTLLEKGEAK